MDKIGSTEIKKFEPRKGYFCPLIRFPWGYNPNIIGKEIDIFEVEGGYYLKFKNQELQQEFVVESTEGRLNELELEINKLKTLISGNKPQNPEKFPETDGPK